MRRLLLAAVLWLYCVAAWAYEPGRASFQVELADKGLINPYRVLALFALPGERLNLSLSGDAKRDDFRVAAAGGAMTAHGRNGWRWRAPAKAGLYPLAISHAASGETMTFNVFVMVPRKQVKDGMLNGYAIGSYPAKPKDDLPIYLPPAGFVEVTAANADTPVAPHLTLGQFLCKQDGEYPKYLVLQERLLLKLELLLEAINARGYGAERLEVMSGYRTPHYNKLLGNATFSYHLYGGAADIYIDADGDQRMDDLNGDGVVDEADGDVLYDLIEEVSAQAGLLPFVGGLGRYRANRYHGPFVHVDVRGHVVRWGRER